ncbi:MAG TPA: restriction endonuclease subunit S [Aequorivita sp.]|nr:restriction endonuclease subunit S [Aequorivita sp.]
MNYIDKLLQGKEVEWKTLGELASLQRGRVMSKNYLAENKGDYPVYSSQTANNGQIGQINSYDFNGEFLTWTTDGANAGTIFYREGRFSITNVCGLISIKENIGLNYRFLFHWLNIEAKSHVYSGMGNPKLMSHQIEKIKIPIPPLSVQREIVRVLDTLSEQNKALTTALANEIDNRKKQYAYYREELFRFEGKEVEWKTLGDVATYSKKRCNISQLNEYNYVGVDNLLQNRSGKTESKHLPFDGNFTAFKFEDILIGNIRPYLKKIWFATCDGGASGDVLVIQNLNDQLNSKYLYQILADDRFFNYNMSFAKGAKMPRGDKKKIMDYKFPIPFPSDKEKSIQEQERIVRLLDQFDTASKNIIAELEKEIELRNKQYEYYRNQLLMFNG